MAQHFKVLKKKKKKREKKRNHRLQLYIQKFKFKKPESIHHQQCALQELFKEIFKAGSEREQDQIRQITHKDQDGRYEFNNINNLIALNIKCQNIPIKKQNCHMIENQVTAIMFL